MTGFHNKKKEYNVIDHPFILENATLEVQPAEDIFLFFIKKENVNVLESNDTYVPCIQIHSFRIVTHMDLLSRKMALF